jgi:hypothetical protein
MGRALIVSQDGGGEVKIGEDMARRGQRYQKKSVSTTPIY